jgi:hypothetical protein
MMSREPTAGRVRAARILGMTADFVQIGLLPLFSPGWLSPLNDALDVVVGGAMVALVGWHWAFVPAFFVELIPVFDLVPSWTAAVLIATRNAPEAPLPLSIPEEGPKDAPPKDGAAGPPQLPSA